MFTRYLGNHLLDMKYFSALFIYILIQGTPILNAFSIPNIPFPKPQFTVEQATQKVSAYHSSISNGNKEWIIVSVKFGNPDILYPKESNYYGVDRKEWCWFVTYANPKKGSTSVYQLTNDGKVYALGYSQT